MIAALAWTALKWLAIICFVGFILFNFFTDPIGSAHVVSSIIGGIGSGIKSIVIFIQNVKP